MVGRLVEEEYLRLFEQQAAQLQPRLFAAAHGRNGLPVFFRESHSVEHGFDPDVGVVTVRGVDRASAAVRSARKGCGTRSLPSSAEASSRSDLAQRVHRAVNVRKYAPHLFVHGLIAFQPAVLLQPADFQPALFIKFFPRRGTARAAISLISVGLSFAVRADKPDPFSLRKGKIYIFEYALVVVAEAYVFRV